MYNSRHIHHKESSSERTWLCKLYTLQHTFHLTSFQVSSFSLKNCRGDGREDNFLLGFIHMSRDLLKSWRKCFYLNLLKIVFFNQGTSSSVFWKSSLILISHLHSYSREYWNLHSLLALWPCRQVGKATQRCD